MLFDRELLDDFDNQSTNNRVICCSAILVYLNFMRELVNAFSHPTAALSVGEDCDFSSKVCTRLHQLIELESVFARCVQRMPAFVPLATDALPAAASVDRSAAAAVAAIAAAGSGSGSGSSLSMSSSLSSSSKSKSKSKGNGKPSKRKAAADDAETFLEVASFKPYFRAFDVHVFSLLALPLQASEHAASVPSGETLNLQPECLLYVLSELSDLVTARFGHAPKAFFGHTSKSAAAAGATSAHALAQSPLALLEALSKQLGVFAHLGRHLKTFIAEMGKPLVDEMDEVRDESSASDSGADQETDADNDADGKKKQKKKKSKKRVRAVPERRVSERQCTILLCCRQTLGALHALLMCEHLQHQEGRNLLQHAMDAVGSTAGAGGSGSGSGTHPFKLLFKALEALTAALNFDDAVLAVKLMDALLTFSAEHTGDTHPHLRANLSSLAHVLLAKRWPASARLRADTLGVLVATEIACSADALDVVERLAAQVLPSVTHDSDDADAAAAAAAIQIDVHATLSSATFAHYFRPAFAQLVSQAEQRLAEKHEQVTNSVAGRIASFVRCASIFSSLLTVGKKFGATHSAVLGSSVKLGRNLIDVVCRTLPFLSTQFKVRAMCSVQDSRSCNSSPRPPAPAPAPAASCHLAIAH